MADFQRAIQREDRIVHRLELARTLIEKNREDEAPAHLEQALRLPHHAPRDPLYQQQARDLLEQIRPTRTGSR